jgi:hypothetical protein
MICFDALQAQRENACIYMTFMPLALINKGLIAIYYIASNFLTHHPQNTCHLVISVTPKAADYTAKNDAHPQAWANSLINHDT